jgi:PAS domain S-box-containing protein
VAQLTVYNEVIASLGRMAASIGSIDVIAEAACRAASEALRGALVRIVQLAPSPRVRHAAGDGDAPVRSGPNTHIGMAMDTDSVTVIDDFTGATAVVDAPLFAAAGFCSGMVAPIRSAPGQSMAMQFLAAQPHAFGDAEREFARACANLLAAAAERKRYEAQLDEARQELKALIDDTPDLILRFDRELRIRFVNPAVVKLTGHATSDFLGRRMDALGGNAERAAEWIDNLQHVIDAGREVEFEATGIFVGRRYDVRCVPERNAEGEIVWVLAVCRDMSEAYRAEEERRQLRQQLDQATRLASIGRLAASVAHEFNNVLMAIQPFADLLQRRGKKIDDATVVDAAQNIAQSIVRGRRITQEMLRYTRPVEPVRAPVDVTTMMRHVLTVMRGAVGDRLWMTLSLPPHPVWILADRTQVEQVFMNLITNARDAVGEGGDLEISVDEPEPGATFPFGIVPRPEDNIHFTFRDSGAGIPPERLPHIFEPLFTTKRIGMGLGLAVAHQMVSMHGGFVFVESEEGLGTAFHVFLPKTAAPDDATSPGRAAIRVRRIAIVEDDMQIVEGMLAVLRDEGFAARYVTKGRNACDLIEDFHPDVVLLDYGLPDADGLEVYRDIRARWPTLPVIFSTGHGDRGRIAEATQDPNVAVLMKPYEIEQLFEVLATIA